MTLHLRSARVPVECTARVVLIQALGPSSYIRMYAGRNWKYVHFEKYREAWHLLRPRKNHPRRKPSDIPDASPESQSELQNVRDYSAHLRFARMQPDWSLASCPILNPKLFGR